MTSAKTATSPSRNDQLVGNTLFATTRAGPRMCNRASSTSNSRASRVTSRDVPLSPLDVIRGDLPLAICGSDLLGEVAEGDQEAVSVDTEWQLPQRARRWAEGRPRAADG